MRSSALSNRLELREGSLSRNLEAIDCFFVLFELIMNCLLSVYLYDEKCVGIMS